jgi:hypothetical protein
MHYAQLVQVFSQVNGASFVGLDSLTEVKLLGGKKNPQQGRVTKRMTGAQIMVFQNKNVNGYEAMVHRRLTAEGKNPATFELGERAWGTRVPNMPIVEHLKDGVVKYYLEVIFLSAGTTEYLLDGQVVPAAQIQGLEARGEGAQGGLDNKVIIRTFAADSVTEVRVNGQVFR